METIRKERIGPLDDYHKYLKDNDYIVHGYRLHFNSVGRILKSLFLLHNETINIWTHALGSLLFFNLFIYLLLTTDYSSSTLYLQDYLSQIELEFKLTKSTIFSSLSAFTSELQSSELPESLKHLLTQTQSTIEKALLLHEDSYTVPIHPVSKWPLFIFLLSAVTCLSCSTLFHLFNAHSHKVKICMNSLDYAGITILILGSFFPPIYYVFYCESTWMYIYLGSITALSIIVLIVTFTPNFQEPHFRWFRGVIFLLLGLCGIFPIGHAAFFMPQANSFGEAMIYYLLMGFFYISGVVIYIIRFPERFFHGKLDYIGNSHNIWHCMIVIAAIFHYFASMESYYQRKALSCNAT